MPYVLAFNRTVIDDKLVRLAAYLGLARRTSSAVVDWVLDLREAIGIPHTLAALGVNEEHAVAFAKMAEAEPSTPSNPRPVTAVELEQLYRNAISGKVN